MPIDYGDDFYSTRLEEDREKADIVRVRLNPEERRMLEALKLSYNEKQDSTALKNAAFFFIRLVLNFQKLGWKK